jgi:hypothetical protein
MLYTSVASRYQLPEQECSYLRGILKLGGIGYNPSLPNGEDLKLLHLPIGRVYHGNFEVGQIILLLVGRECVLQILQIMNINEVIYMHHNTR